MSGHSSVIQVPSPDIHHGVDSRRSQPMGEKEIFYENFLHYREINQITIRSYQIRKQRFSEYAVYHICICTMDMTYEIERRYSEFDSLYQTISLNYPKAVLPDFPKKRIFRNLCKACLEERKTKLGEFMQNLLEMHKEFKIYEFLDFIQIYDKYKHSKDSFNLVSSLKNCKSHASTKDDYLLLELLIKLNISQQDRLQNFQKINDFLFEKKPKISTKIVEILIKGDGSLKGLVQILGCGHSENHLVCSIGFKLFCSLFDHEYNKAADFFLEVFTKISQDEFLMMQLGDHIVEKPAKNCKQYALKLVEFYLDANPNALNHEKFSSEARKEYQKYKNKRSMICQKVESFERKPEFFKQGKQSLEANYIKSAMIKHDSSFSKLLLFNNHGEKFSSSN